MSEKCPKCGANRTKFEGQCSWDCGTYQSVIGGSHIHNPQFKLIEGAHCKDRQKLAALTQRVEHLEKFKAYTHQRLDELGAPESVPESPHTAAGCRVGGRFDWVAQRLEQAERERDRLREFSQKQQNEIESISYMGDAVERLRDIANATGCDHVDSKDGRLRLVHCVEEVIAAAENKATAAESREKRLREVIEACNPNRFFVHSGSDLDYIWDRLSALLAQPSDGKEAEGASL